MCVSQQEQQQQTWSCLARILVPHSRGVGGGGCEGSGCEGGGGEGGGSEDGGGGGLPQAA